MTHSWEVVRADGIRLPDGKHLKDNDETAYTYLGILETDKIKEKEMKDKTDIKIEIEWKK